MQAIFTINYRKTNPHPSHKHLKGPLNKGILGSLSLPSSLTYPSHHHSRAFHMIFPIAFNTWKKSAN